MRNEKFDDLRPYYNEEIAPAMLRIAESEYFPLVSAFIYPDREVDEIKNMIKGYTTIEEFQYEVTKTFVDQVVARSIRRLTFDGYENLDPNKRYLFISNHRDIVLDSTLFQYILHFNFGHRPSEITFGSNLMSSQLIIDIGKSNKMFKVVRGGSIKDFYNNSLHLSDYIRYAITEKQESIWIAQRNGRTKDGKDATDQGIIKMFYMSSPDNPVKALAELNIVPIAVSYQWESCDILKALELYQSRFEKYVKKPGEDLNSILTGITQTKGDVHISVGMPLSESDLAPLAGLPNNKFNMQAASLIDTQIYKRYKLTCNNYIAHDIRSRSKQYAPYYTEAEKQLFVQHYNEALAFDMEDKKTFGDIFLGIYANPVDSHVE
ncbi:glycerol acyltransferase [Bacteroidia bacterium]|nr:glycerol acyltransferase [Bacteroidia bacterium]GHT86734.1 glycerol acyltransferase [Bacteroidia bacterium]